MKRSWIAARLGALAMLALASAVSFTPVEARPEPKAEREKAKDPAAWSEPVVSGNITDTYWTDGLTKGSRTAVIVIWSAESDLGVTIYGDDPSVRNAIVAGEACVGRYVVVSGDRLDEGHMVGRGIEQPDLGKDCERSLQPEA